MSVNRFGAAGRAASPDQQSALSFDRLVYHGDNLTDSGALFAALSAVAFFGIPLSALGYAEQCSNGTV